jgi:hypothetical protein
MADELNKPSRGTGDWDIPVNENFDTLEAAARAFLPRGTTQTLNVDSADVTNQLASNSVTTGSVDADRVDTTLFGPISGGSTPAFQDFHAQDIPDGGSITISSELEVNVGVLTVAADFAFGAAEFSFDGRFGDNVTLLSSNGQYTETQGSSSKVNVFFSNGQLTVENLQGNALTAVFRTFGIKA